MITRRSWLGLAAAGFATLSTPLRALPDPARAGIRRQYVPCEFGQLHLRIAKPGAAPSAPPVVLFHQSPLSGRMFDALLPLLAQGRRAIAVDTPGYGESDRPQDRPDLSGYADAIAAALPPVAGTHYDVLGYHTGAAIAADLASRQKAVRRAVLIAFPFLEDALRSSLLDSFEEPKSYDAAGSHLERQWEGSLGARAEGQSLADIARTVAEKERPGLYGEWALHSAIEADLTAILARIARPTLFLAPHDGLLEETREAARMVAGAQIEELPGLAYGLFDAAPQRIADAVLDFLDR